MTLSLTLKLTLRYRVNLFNVPLLRTLYEPSSPWPFQVRRVRLQRHEMVKIGNSICPESRIRTVCRKRNPGKCPKPVSRFRSNRTPGCVRPKLGARGSWQLQVQVNPFQYPVPANRFRIKDDVIFTPIGEVECAYSPVTSPYQYS